MTALVLIGPPGSGKTTVGALLAERLGVDFADTDAMVEEAAGTTIAELFLTEGEEHFRALERQAVARALAEHDGVLSLGGGAVLDADTRADLTGHRVVFLSVGLSDAARRVGLSTARPLLLGSPRRQWQELMEARRPLYQAASDVEVSTSGRNPEEIASEVLDRVPGLTG